MLENSVMPCVDYSQRSPVSACRCQCLPLSVLATVRACHRQGLPPSGGPVAAPPSPLVRDSPDAAVVIAGGTSGVGLASALGFAAAGVRRLVLLGRTAERGEGGAAQGQGGFSGTPAV